MALLQQVPGRSPFASRLQPLLALALASLSCGPKPAPSLADAFLPVSLCATCPPAAPPACPAGSAAFPADAACAPVGASCEAPLVPDSSGWGCVAVLPATGCTGATRELAGSTTCAPIGDCGATFPPAGATIFVDDGFAQVDATHFRSISAAARAARSGDVIAIDEGTYPEPIIAPPTNVTLIGRCAEKVRVTGAGGNQVGLYAYNAQKVVARGLTITGHVGGVFAELGELTLEDSVVEGNAAVGVFAKLSSTITVRNSRISQSRYVPGGELGAGVVSNTGSRVTLEDVTLTANDHRGASVGGAGSTLSCNRCVVARGRRAAGETEAAAALLAVDDGVLSVASSVVLDHDGVGLLAEKATVTLVGSVIDGTRGKLATQDGIGVLARSRARVLVRQTTLANHPVIGVYADGAGTAVDALEVTLRGPPTLTGVEIGRGAQVTTSAVFTAKNLAVFRTSSAGLAFQDAARGELENVAVAEVREIGWPSPSMLYGGFGVLCEERSSCSAKRLSVQRATLSGVSSTVGATFTLERAAVQATQRSSSSGGGNAGQVANDATLFATGSYFADSQTTGFIVVGGGTLALAQSTVTATNLDPSGGFGHGITVFRRGIVRLEDTLLSKHPGVALVADDAQSWVKGGELAGNAVALHVQNGSFVTQVDGEAALQPGEVRVSSATSFKDNQTRLGLGVVPLPTP